MPHQIRSGQIQKYQVKIDLTSDQISLGLGQIRSDQMESDVRLGPIRSDQMKKYPPR